MKKESKLERMFKRDEILRKQVVDAGFVVFMITTLFWAIRIAGELLNKEVTFKQVEYSLKMIGSNVVLFILMLFLLLVAKKRYFNNITASILTGIGSIYYGIRLYMDGMEPWGLLLFGWALITVLIYIIVKYAFKSISETLTQ